MDLGISNKRALIIGGSSGLGLAAAKALAAEGVNVALAARNVGNLQAAAGQIEESFDVSAEVFSGDMTLQDDVRALAEWTRTTGGVDILVVNTPRPPSPMRNFLDETEDARWRQARVDQLDSPLFVLRHLVPLMLNKGWGRIIGVTSASVKQPMPRHAISSIFRSGLQVALKYLVEEVAPHGITVNVISPATVLTPTFAQFHDLERRTAGTALKRAGTLEEFGGTVAFLASQQAGFITGENIQFDGGMTKALF